MMRCVLQYKTQESALIQEAENESFSHQAGAAAYYEGEASNNLIEGRPILQHHAHSIGKALSAGKRDAH
jgi:hypothetical protein